MKKYLVADGWGHIFVGSQPSYTKWVFNVAARKLVCGFVLEGRYWLPPDGYVLLDLQEDVEHNVLRAIDKGELEDDDFLATNRLPTWAQKPDAEHLR